MYLNAAGAGGLTAEGLHTPVVWAEAGAGAGAVRQSSARGSKQMTVKMGSFEQRTSCPAAGEGCGKRIRITDGVYPCPPNNYIKTHAHFSRNQQSRRAESRDDSRMSQSRKGRVRGGKQAGGLTAPDAGGGVAAVGAGGLLDVEAVAAATPAQSVRLVAALTCGMARNSGSEL